MQLNSLVTEFTLSGQRQPKSAQVSRWTGCVKSNWQLGKPTKSAYVSPISFPRGEKRNIGGKIGNLGLTQADGLYVADSKQCVCQVISNGDLTSKVGLTWADVPRGTALDALRTAELQRGAA